MQTLSIGEYLVKSRKKRQWKQSTICRRTNISSSRLSRLESGQRYPTPDEWRELDHLLELGPYRRPPDEPSAPADWKTALPPLNRTNQKPLISRLYAAKRTFGHIVDQTLSKVQARQDADVAQHFLSQSCSESGSEYRTWLGLLAQGAQPHWFSPLKAGYRCHCIVDEQTGQVASDLKHPCLSVEIIGAHLLLFPQVSVRTRKGQFRLDALVCLKIGRNRFWANLEIDGGGHDATFDRERQLALNLETIRLDAADLQSTDLLAVLERKLAGFIHAQAA